MTGPDTFYARTFALAAAALLAWLLYLVLSPLAQPIAWALFLAFLVHPLHRWLTRRLRGRATLSAALLTAFTFVVLIGPLGALGTAFAAQVADLARRAQEFAGDRDPADLGDLASLPVLGPALAWAQETTGISLAQLEAWVLEAARTILRWLGGLGRTAVLGALGTVIGFALMMFILFFAIRDAERFYHGLRALVPLAECQ